MKKTILMILAAVAAVSCGENNGSSPQKTADYTQKNPDYVIIGGLKWARCNIGAAKETDYGYYFFWGGTERYVYDSANSKWVKASDGTKLSGGFTWPNTPFNNGRVAYDDTYFKSVKDTECPGGVLASKNDVAAVYCGSGWRMPTADDFKALYEACGGAGEYMAQASGGSTSTTKRGKKGVNSQLNQIPKEDLVRGGAFERRLELAALSMPNIEDVGYIGAGNSVYDRRRELTDTEFYKNYRSHEQSGFVRVENATTKGVHWCESYDGVTGLLFCDGTKVVLPRSRPRPLYRPLLCWFQRQLLVE